MAQTVITKSSLNVDSGDSSGLQLSNTSATTLLAVGANQYAICTLTVLVVAANPTTNFIIDFFDSTSGFRQFWAVWYSTNSSRWYSTDDKTGISAADLVANGNSLFPIYNSGQFVIGPNQTIQVRQSASGGNYNPQITINYVLLKNT